MTILDSILERTREIVAKRKRETPRRMLEGEHGFGRAVLDFPAALGAAGVAFLAESKRRSPSKGLLRDPYSAAENVRMYEAAGAAACSVLTEPDFFGGAPDDLIAAREVAAIPLLRKDFVVDEYQLFEARAWGADAVLLIASALDRIQLRDLDAAARGLGLHVLLELHDVRELDRIDVDRARVIGVNHRDLSTFEVDLTRSHDVFRLLPAGIVRVAESGLRDAETVADLARKGADAFLIGEAFMREPHPGDALARLRDEVEALLEPQN